MDDYERTLKAGRVINDIPFPASKRLTLKDLRRVKDEQVEQEEDIDVLKLKEHLRHEGKLTVEDAILLAKKAADVFRKEKNTLELKAPVTMFGDVHGQFYDLIQKTDEMASPNDASPWLFLGDYVDRGIFGVEVVLYLFALKVAFPNSVYLIRGNHECRHLTGAYNFKKECLAKYKSVPFYNAVMETFDCLPLAAVVEGGNGHRFFCVHGGLSPDIKTIEDINNLNRFVEPPQSGPMCDILWSDPLEDNTANNLPASEMEEWYAVEFFENETRGAGYIFGYTAVMDFLTRNNITTIIRAHDVQRTGYSELFMHCKENRLLPLVVTLFSAPNYCGSYGNEAAILRVEPAAMQGTPPVPILRLPEANNQMYQATSVEGSFTEDSISSGCPTPGLSFTPVAPPGSPQQLNTPRDVGMNTPREMLISPRDVEIQDEDEPENQFDEGLMIEPEPLPVEHQEEDPATPYFPKLVYTRFDCVRDIPYYLPNFENGIQHSVPLVIEKIMDFLASLPAPGLESPRMDPVALIPGPASVPVAASLSVSAPPTLPSPVPAVGPDTPSSVSPLLPSPIVPETTNPTPTPLEHIPATTPTKIPPDPTTTTLPIEQRKSSVLVDRTKSNIKKLVRSLTPNNPKTKRASDIKSHSTPQFPKDQTPEISKRSVSDRISQFETRKVPIVITSGDAQKRRKSVEALSGSFQHKMKLYLSVITPTSCLFDKIKLEKRMEEVRPPVILSQYEVI